MATLRALFGSGPEAPLTLTGERTVLGRHPACEMVINKGAASRQHAQIVRVEGVYFIEDLRSRNGTFLNEVRIEGRRPLKEHDRIKICDAVFEFSLRGGAASPLESLPQLLREQNVNFRGPSWQTVQADLREETSPLSRRLRQEFPRVIVLDANEGEGPGGTFDMDLFLQKSWARMAAAFGLPNDDLAFHPQQIAQTLKSEEPALFCFLNIQRLSEDELHQLRGLGFTQEDHHVLYVGPNEALRSMAFPLTSSLAESGCDSPDEDADIAGIVSSSTLMRAPPPRRSNAEIRLREALSIGRALLASGNDPAAIARTLLDVAAQALSRSESGTVLLREDSGELTVVATRDRPSTAQAVRVLQTVVRDAMQSNRATLSTSVMESDPGGVPVSDSISSLRVASVMCAPLCGLDGEVLGVVQLCAPNLHRFDEDDLDVLASLASQTGIALRSAQLQARLLEQQRREHDLRLATTVQLGFLPNARPSLPGYEFADYYQPADFVGGDYYTYLPTDSGRLVMAVADVAGRGVSASLVMALLASAVRHHVASAGSLTGALAAVNAELVHFGSGNRFVTLVLAELDPAANRLTVANAGHMAPLVRRNTGEIESLGDSATGLPAGVIAGAEYESASTQLEPGDVLLLYTDGVTEVLDSENRIYGQERVREMLTRRSDNAADLLEMLRTDIQSFSRPHGPRDDICVIACRRMG